MQRLMRIMVITTVVLFTGCSIFHGGDSNKYLDANSPAQQSMDASAQGYQDPNVTSYNQQNFYQNSQQASDDQRCQAGAMRAGAVQHYFFGFDQTVPANAINDSLRQQANYLLSNPEMKARLEGNTDVCGAAEYNVALGYKRAQAVAAQLKQYGVPAAQIRVVSFGGERPIVAQPNEASGFYQCNPGQKQLFQCNRRVDFLFTRR